MYQYLPLDKGQLIRNKQISWRIFTGRSQRWALVPARFGHWAGPHKTIFGNLQEHVMTENKFIHLIFYVLAIILICDTTHFDWFQKRSKKQKFLFKTWWFDGDINRNGSCDIPKIFFFHDEQNGWILFSPRPTKSPFPLFHHVKFRPEGPAAWTLRPKFNMVK